MSTVMAFLPRLARKVVGGFAGIFCRLGLSDMEAPSCAYRRPRQDVLDFDDFSLRSAKFWRTKDRPDAGEIE